MSAETRGQAIKARRLALGIRSLRAFAEASGISREALTAAEEGNGSSGTLDRAEAWLDRTEFEMESDAVPAPSTEPIRLTFHDVYGIGEFIAEGPADRPDELIAAVTKMLREIRERGDQGGS